MILGEDPKHVLNGTVSDICVQVGPEALHHTELCSTEVLGGSRWCSERLQDTPGQSRRVSEGSGGLLEAMGVLRSFGRKNDDVCMLCATSVQRR